MLDILEFIFQDFWHWFGTFLFLIVIVDGLSGMFRTVVIKTKDNDKC